MNMTSSLRDLNPRKLVPSVLVVQKMETVSSVTDQCVISLSLLANINPHAITQPSWGTIRAVCQTCSTARPPYRLSRAGLTANGSVATVRTNSHHSSMRPIALRKNWMSCF